MVFVVSLLDPIPQDPAYHLFADRRTFLGIPNFNDVVSSLGFAPVGFFGLLALPLIIGLFAGYRYTIGRYLAWALFWYGLSKIIEYLDAEIFELLGGYVSGHTLKHLAAAVAPFVVLRILKSGISAKA